MARSSITSPSATPRTGPPTSRAECSLRGRFAGVLSDLPDRALRFGRVLVVALFVGVAAACADDARSFPEGASAEQLTVVSECGYFQIASADGSLRLQLRWAIDFPPDFERIAAQPVIELPDDRWSARLQAGTNLIPTCSDVIDPSDPQPEVHHDVPVVSGNVVLTEIPRRLEDRATAELTDLEFRDPDGLIRSFGDVTISTDRFGFFSG